MKHISLHRHIHILLGRFFQIEKHSRETEKMSYPTGMSASTGNHYHNVAAQMQAYLHNGASGGQNLHSAHGQMNQYQQAPSVAYASRFGVDPVIANDVGGFARRFMRNLLT